MTSIQEMFDVKEQLSKNLSIPHVLALPKIKKIVINAGIGKQKEDNKAIEKIKKDMSLLSGQMPVVKNAKKAIANLTEIGVALLALAIVASLLVGASNMAFFGGVVGNITSLVSQLGSSGLAGLISLGVVLWLFQR